MISYKPKLRSVCLLNKFYYLTPIDCVNTFMWTFSKINRKKFSLHLLLYKNNVFKNIKIQ